MAKSTIESSTEAILNVAKTEAIKVLHVDDDLVFLEVAKQCLEMQDEIDVDTVSSVDEALEKLKQKDYDAIVSDYQMPGKDGLEFLKELREKGNTVPFIVVTGKGREEVAIEALNLGADQYIDKHGNPEAVYCELAHSIRVAVERKKAEEALSAERDKLETVTRSIGAGLAIISKDYHTLWANDVLKQIFGDVEGKICYSIYNQRNDICPKCGVQEIFETGKAKVVHEQVGKDVDGKTIWSEITATPIKDRDGNITAVLELIIPVTQRKMAEAELRSSAEKYGKLFDEAMDAIFVADAETGILIDCNRAASELVGREKSELIGKHQRILHPPEKTEEKFSTTFKQHLKEKEGQILETQVITKKGEIKDVAIKANVFELENKRVVQGIFRDITEHKKAEQTLKESEEKYRGLVELAPDGILVVNAEGIVTSANRSFLTLVGYDPEEIIGKPFTELKSSRVEDIPKFQGMFMSLMKEEPLSPVEFLYVRRDGTSRWAEVHPSLLVKEGNPVGAQVIMTDVSERKNAEKLIQENQQKFEQLFMSNPEAAVYVDPNERVLNVNPHLTALFGYSFDEVKEKFLDDFVVPEDRKKEALMLAQKGKEGYVYYETVRKNKKGSLIPVTLSTAPIKLQGQHLGDIVLYNDITERKRAEEERREAMEKVQMMNEKLRVVGGLTRHDVNNKLTAVTGCTYLARNKLPRNSEVLNYLKQIEASIEQTAQIFDFAKAYEMLGVEELAYVDVEKTVDEAVSLFPSLKDIKVMNDCHGLTVLADSLLKQLFYNLIDNSLKYGEKLSCIRVYYEEKNGNHLDLIYEDNGVGIPHAAKPKLFGEGYTTGKGSGYGLYLIKRMMEVYGWTIQEAGTPAKRTQFTVTIPKTNPKGMESYHQSGLARTKGSRAVCQ